LATTFAGTRLITISAIRIRGGTVIPIGHRIRDTGGVLVMPVEAGPVATLGAIGREGVVMMAEVGLGVVAMLVVLAAQEVALVDRVMVRRRRAWLITRRGVA